jgi:large subunit ribosomal protein L4
MDLDPKVFGAPIRGDLLHTVNLAQQAAKRSGTAAVKNRANVSGGGIKPWRQKGTGQARAGSIRSPIWVGGGRAFAAKPRDFTQKVNRKMYRGAMQAMLSELARTERLSVVNGIELEAPKTKLLLQTLADLKLGSNVLIVIEAHDEKLELAARNLPYIDVLPVSSLDPLSLARHDHVLATAGAVRQLEERLA